MKGVVSLDTHCEGCRCGTNGVTGTPTEFARFPGTYKVDSVGIRVPDGVEYYPSDGKGSDWRWVGGFMQYIPPGPPVWTG